MNVRVTRLLGLALVACAVLTTEIVLTRVFSVVMWYHFAFLAISMALFGMGLGGVAMHALGDRLVEKADSVLAYAGAGLGVANGAAVFVLLTLRLGAFSFDKTALLHLGLVYLVSALPFLAGGVFISLMLRLGHRRAGLLYLFDLAGASLGCLATIPLLHLVGGPAAVLVAGALAAIGGLVAAGSIRPVRFTVGVTVAVALLAVVGLHLYQGGQLLEPRYVKGNVEPTRLAVGWNSFSRVIAYKRPDVGDVMMLIDGIAHTPITPFHGDAAATQTPAAYIQRLPYLIRPGASTLIFGSGGGEHILTALDAGAKKIVGVEMNPIVVDWVDHRFANVAGGLFHQPGVQVVVDEGRSYIRRSADKFDLIQFTLVDTWAATAAGAFALTENNIFTLEAMHEYLDHLTPGGMISLKRWREAPEYILRLMALARAALEQRGVKDTAACFFIARDAEFANLIIKTKPFSIDEVGRLAEQCEKLGLHVVYSPYTPCDGQEFIALAHAGDLDRWLGQQKLDMSPPTDDHPFLFYTLRTRDLPQVFKESYTAKIRNIGPAMLYGLLALVFFFVVVLILVPAWLTRDQRERPPRRIPYYFATLGLAYLLVEVALMQKFILFLGHPTYALAVVLFTLLLSSSLGAALSERISPDRASHRVILVVGLLFLYAAVLLIVSPTIFRAMLAREIAVRIAVSAGLLAPLGLLMGMPFPVGVRLVGFNFPRSVPWMFAINSAASVLGSVSAMLLAVQFGFNTAIMTGLGLYLIAGLLL